jgi:hypothetical protein
MRERGRRVQEETETVIANSRRRRPTRPLMNSSGMKTAMREKLIEIMVNPI